MDWKQLPADILQKLDTLPDTIGVSEKHAAVILGVSVSKLQKDRVKGGGPRFVKVGEGKGGRVSYLLGELRAFLRRRSHASTSTYLATDMDLSELALARPYAVSAGQLKDFVNTLGEEVDDIVWLTREEHRKRS
jgi:hypothetical protein